MPSPWRRMLSPAAAELPSGVWAALTVAVRAMVVFTAPLWVPVAGVAAVSAAAGWLLPMVLAVSALLLLTSLIVHEAGHVTALRVLSPDTTAVFSVDARGAGVHRRPLAATWQEVTVVLAGPVAPVAVWASAMAAGWAWGGIPAAAVVWTGAVALGHPISLLAPVGDTRSLLRALAR